jgi:DNA-binding Lrp family transcriptional regulator
VEDTAMKEVELKLVIELLKDSSRSDRELARVIEVSQPTVSRIRKGLEKRGLVKEYTIIPDFQQLGFELMSMTFTKFRVLSSKQGLDDLKRRAGEAMREHPSALILGCIGMGCNADYVTIAFHKHYSEYLQFMKDIKQFPNVNIDETRSFLIDLCDRNQFQPLSFYHLVGYLERTKKDFLATRTAKS